jgi:hypothetical protein
MEAKLLFSSQRLLGIIKAEYKADAYTEYQKGDDVLWREIKGGKS